MCKATNGASFWQTAQLFIWLQITGAALCAAAAESLDGREGRLKMHQALVYFTSPGNPRRCLDHKVRSVMMNYGRKQTVLTSLYKLEVLKFYVFLISGLQSFSGIFILYFLSSWCSDLVRWWDKFHWLSRPVLEIGLTVCLVIWFPYKHFWTTSAGRGHFIKGSESLSAMDNHQKRNLTFLTIGLIFTLSGIEYGKFITAAL